ncbi:MAG: multicopper oxidase domain-containing protein [Nitrosopumilus sp.]|nr:multicopper oxidase domain-containing protein [Nitrosopumilus sp.]
MIISSIFISNYSPNQAYAQSSNDKNNKNGIEENRGYSTNVTEYDKKKNCSNDLDKEPNATEYLTYFNCGHVKINDENQSTIREFTLIVDENQTIPISNQGHQFKAWTFNGTVPGPTMRMTEGDQVKITVINTANNSLPHSMHMHSIHPAVADGVEGDGGAILPGHNFTYTFTANPYGVYPYHCHVNPIADHMNRGLYGMFIIDPKEPREQMQEFAMLMNGYDMNYELEGAVTIPEVDKNDPTKFIAEEGEEERDNEIYTVNGKAFEYMDHPIKIEQGKEVRIYLVNMLEFDLVNSFHSHGMMFNYISSGTSEDPEIFNDIVTLSQGDRGIIEMNSTLPGKYMFHAHQAEFTDLGWMGFFNVVAPQSNNIVAPQSNNIVAPQNDDDDNKSSGNSNSNNDDRFNSNFPF